MKRLREYQEAAVSEIRDALHKHRAVVLNLKTGLGKTVVAGHIAQRLAANGLGALALVHRRELVHQFCSTLDDFGLRGQYGLMQSGMPESPWARFQVASIQTLFRRHRDWLKPHMVIVDEAHHAKARTWQSVIERYPSAYLLGLTATPCRLDGKPLGDIFNHMVNGPTWEEAQDDGWLAGIRVKFDKQHLSTEGVSRVGGDFSRKQLGERVTEKVVADAFHAYERHVKPLGKLPTLFYGVNTTHSIEVVETFRRNGYHAEHVDGSMGWAQRDEIFKKFREGEIDIVGNCDIVSEGADFPGCRVILDGQPTLSVARYIQKGGRAARPNPDGEDSLYIDLAGNFWEHGYPDEERLFSLEGARQGQSNEIVSPRARFRVCRACFEVYRIRMRECPGCGEPADTVQAPKQEERELEDAPQRERDIRRNAHNKASLRRELAKVVARHGKGSGARQAIEDLRLAYGCSPRWRDNMFELLGL